ncbi:MAG: hypothetical protein JSR19_05760 [Proteobacteria bacterium]|nr:hypothetical protein [Pseudomonadota bacterium]
MALCCTLPAHADTVQNPVQAGSVPRRDGANVMAFGAAGNGVADDTAAIVRAIAAVSAQGGEVYFPAGTYRVTAPIVIGNGSDSAQSTIGHKVSLRGAGYGTGTEVSNVSTQGVTQIVYGGPPGKTMAVVEFAGPLHSVAMSDMLIDGNGLAGIGIDIIHVTQGTFSRVAVRSITSIGWNLTTRSGFPAGVAYGNASNRFYDCYSFSPANFSASGLALTSGVSPSVSLAGNPDSAQNLFFGGSFIYGGDKGSYGAWLHGADNNQFIGTFFYPRGGNAGGGYDVFFEQWPGSDDFPKENVFTNIAMTRGVGASRGAGPTGGNFFWPFQTGDGAMVPALGSAQTMTFNGQTYINGVRAWRGRQIASASNSRPQSTSSNQFVDVPGLVAMLATKRSSQLKIEFSGAAAKSTSGQGFFQIVVDGIRYGDTTSIVPSSGGYSTASSIRLLPVEEGMHTVKIQFRSDTPAAVTLNNGVLIVEELY